MGGRSRFSAPSPTPGPSPLSTRASTTVSSTSTASARVSASRSTPRCAWTSRTGAGQRSLLHPHREAAPQRRGPTAPGLFPSAPARLRLIPRDSPFKHHDIGLDLSTGSGPTAARDERRQERPDTAGHRVRSEGSGPRPGTRSCRPPRSPTRWRAIRATSHHRAPGGGAGRCWRRAAACTPCPPGTWGQAAGDDVTAGHGRSRAPWPSP